MNELMNNLFHWDQHFFLQSVFLRYYFQYFIVNAWYFFSLDSTSLRRCREVCLEWKLFIDARVWGCGKYKSMILRWRGIKCSCRRRNTLFCKITRGPIKCATLVTGDWCRRLWREFSPSVRTLSLVSKDTDQITSIVCDDNVIFCGFTSGICKLYR